MTRAAVLRQDAADGRRVLQACLHYMDRGQHWQDKDGILTATQRIMDSVPAPLLAQLGRQTSATKGCDIGGEAEGSGVGLLIGIRRACFWEEGRFWTEHGRQMSRVCAWGACLCERVADDILMF